MKQILLVPIGLLLIGCGSNREQPSVPFSLGPAKHVDVGSYILKHPLPADADDAYIEIGKTPESSFGVLFAHRGLSQRSHATHDLVLYGHNGRARFHVGEKDFTLNIGDVLFIPRGVVYSAENSGDQQLQWFVVFTPMFDGKDVIYAEKKE